MTTYESIEEFRRKDPEGFRRQARKFIGDGSGITIRPATADEIRRMAELDPLGYERMLGVLREARPDEHERWRRAVARD